MNLSQLLQGLAQAGIQLRAAGDNLEIVAPRNALTAQLREALSQQKQALLAWLREQSLPLNSSAPDAIVPDVEHRFDPFPLTEIQQAYWVGRSGMIALGDVATHFYIEIEVFNLDLERLSSAWRKLIERHDMLRAVILPGGEQRVLAEVPPYEFALVDLRAKGEPALEAIRDRLSHQVLPSSRWPLFEILATQLSDDRFRIHISLDLLVCDLDSMLRLFDEWARYYNDPGVTAPCPALSFRDYVIAERALREGPEFQKARQYWLQRLDSLPPGPQLPLAENAVPAGSHRFTRRQSHLSAEVWQQLKQRASRAGLTPSVVLLAAFAEVLGVWSKSLHFTLNMTVFNRMPLHPEVQEIVGDFTSVNLLDVDLRARESFFALASRLGRQLWQDLEHRLFSGVNVLRELARRKGSFLDVAVPVVFTSALSSSGAIRDASVFSRLGETVYGISQTPQVWLDHQVMERDGALVFNWDAVEELFPLGLLDAMLKAYCELLDRLAGTDAAWSADTRDLLPASQKEERGTANATSAPPRAGRLEDGFLSQASLRPQAVAIVSSRRSLTYSEVARSSAAIAHRLRQAGVLPNRLVAVVMEKGWEQVAAVMGALMAGAAYVPIDPDLPSERLTHLLKASEVNIVLTQPWLSRALDTLLELTCIVVDQSLEALPQPLPANSAHSAQDLAYVIYTSGSSGLPKGVMTSHTAALNTIDDLNRRFTITSNDRVLALSALSFDLSVFDIFGLLAAGGAVVIPDPERARDPAHWDELIREHNVTVWNSVPALMQILADSLEVRRARLPQSLRLALLSGDWIPVSLPGRVSSLSDGIQLVSLGGATEAAIWSIFHSIDRVEEDWTSVPYGRPLVNQRLHILNDRWEPCPEWVPGNLYIAGAGLAEGYWRDESRTHASFVIHPVTGERLYRTGDLGRYRPGGLIEFLGREDLQVKINGYRVELGEIEAALLQHPSVRQAVASTSGSQRGRLQLVAYVVHRDSVSSDELRRFLLAKLPDYMVPSSFVVLDVLPLTANGKVDRKALSALETQRVSACDEPSACLSPTEELIAALWRDVLNVARVGVHDNFFELGGDSVAAIQVMSRIRESCGVELPLRRLFETPTPAGLAHAVTSLQLQEATPEELSEMLAVVEGLTEQEAEELL
ncbi:MAG TPA: amino acid adenylation domain-containing protein [Terracidiphilus sp.]|nr:amino acid adenylation domain-containing protein [Terracidiphilus sp.]